MSNFKASEGCLSENSHLLRSVSQSGCELAIDRL